MLNLRKQPSRLILSHFTPDLFQIRENNNTRLKEIFSTNNLVLARLTNAKLNSSRGYFCSFVASASFAVCVKIFFSRMSISLFILQPAINLTRKEFLFFFKRENRVRRTIGKKIIYNKF